VTILRYIVFFVLVAQCIVAQKKTNFCHQFLIHQANCAGASETGGAVLFSETNKPYTLKKIYLYKGKKCIDSITTDETGKIHLRLKKGDYQFYLPYKHFRSAPFGKEVDYHTHCLEKEWEKPDATLYISRRKVSFDNTQIGFEPCAWQYPCLKKPIVQPGQN